MNKRILLLVFALLLVPSVLAPNDPGHDSLYIEQTGDSELTGKLNITSDLKVDGNQSIAGLYLYGDGSQPTTLN